MQHIALTQHDSIRTYVFPGGAQWIFRPDGLYLPTDYPAQDFNTSGQVVGSSGGYATVSGKGALFGYTNSGPDSYSPGYLSEMLLPGFNIPLAAGIYIDDSGRIIASGEYGFDFYLLTPTPEPSTLATLGLAIAGLGVRAWRRRKAATIR